MKFRLLTAAVMAACMSCICLKDADAWGTRAQRAIVAVAIQIIQDDYPNTFSPEEADYIQDVLRGCVDGVAVLSGSIPLGSDAETIAAVDSEIQLLRDARKLGPTSYFAYRMGVLSALVSNVVLPYGFAWTPEDKALQAKIVRDIEKRIDIDYGKVIRSSRREPIYEAQDYFNRHRLFRQQNRQILRDDYETGLGHKGLLLKSGPAYFAHAINSVADAWSTVLISTTLPRELPTPSTILSWYCVNEIDYLLDVRKNYYQAGKTYANFDNLSANQSAGYETIGDHYYAFSESGATERGVQEWMLAYTMDGANRVQIAAKLHDHFLDKGAVFLERGLDKDLADESGTDLPNALTAFEEALRYKPESNTLANYIQETRIEIMERQERFDITISFISKGESVREEAANARNIDKDYGLAISMYRRAVFCYEAIDDEFINLSNRAKTALGQLNRDINGVVNLVIENATATIEDGIQAEADDRYDEAIRLYELVFLDVSIIPEDINTSVTDNKNEVIATANKKIEDAKVAKARWVQNQQLLQQQLQQAEQVTQPLSQ